VPGGLLAAAELRQEDLAVQCPLDQVHRARRGGQPAALAPVHRQHGLDDSGRQIGGELRAGRPVALPGPFDAGGHVMAGQRRERHRMAQQHAVHAVVGRYDVEQPVDRSLLESLAAGRMNAGGPAGGKISCHLLSIASFEYVFHISALTGQPARCLPGSVLSSGAVVSPGRAVLPEPAIPSRCGAAES
jgi:hypothetical protein